MTDLQQYLRLEVERDPDPGELVNLIPNPDGALGAWGWVTPVPGSTMRANVVSGIRFLTYESPGGVPSRFYSVPMEVEAGKWISTREMAIAVNGQYRLTVEWLNVSKAVIGSTAQSPAYGQSSTPRAYGSFKAPSGTFYCRFRFDHYDGTGGNPTAGAILSFRDVVLTAADTAGELGWTRTNLCRNPSAEAGTTYWTAENGVLDTSSAHAWVGSKSFRVTKGEGKAGPLVARYAYDVTPGRDYALQVRCRPSTVARKVTVAARWLDAAGKQIAQPIAGTRMETTGGWSTPIGGVVTAPTSAARLQTRIVWAGVPEGERHLFDAVMIEQASTVQAYFDGDTDEFFGITHAWDGTAGLSTSTQTGPAGDPGELVPVPYQNILGPTGSIAVDREELNVGSMSVKLFDAVLDPTQSDLIKTGRRIRLVATPPATGEDIPDPQVLFAGKVFTGSVTYHLLRADEAKRAEVTLTAVDPINPLANTPSREGVATIADLPHVLEAAGVPWSVNGNGNQVAAPTVVAYNDNASALDQVAVTRDSALGFAWVDRNGVLQAWDRDLLDGTVVDELDESTYTADLNIDFDLESLINSVTVKVLRVIATTGATEEVSFGPYVHAQSFRDYGERSKEFVVQGFDANDTAAIQEYAEAILAASALPRMRVNELVLPIAGQGIDEPRLDRALVDLYDLVHVSNDRAGLDENARVMRIHHEITATNSGGKWTTTLGFTADGSIAPSTAVPSPPPSVGEVVGEVRDDLEGSLAELNADLETLNTTTLPQVQADLNYLNTVALPSLQGKFPITSTSISDGAITTPKMTANSINGDRILANTLHADKIVANSITGDKVQANSIGADKIVANSIGADRLSANAINGKTITGATLQTATNGQRVVVDTSNTVKFYDSGDAQRGVIAGLPSGMRLTGNGSAFVQVASTGVGIAGHTSMDSFETAGGGNGSIGGNLSLIGNLSMISGNISGVGRITAANTAAWVEAGGEAVYMKDSGRLCVHANPSRREWKTGVERIDVDPDALAELAAYRFRYRDDVPFSADPDETHYGYMYGDAEALGLDLLIDVDGPGGLAVARKERLPLLLLAAWAKDRARVSELERVAADLTARVEALEANERADRDR